MRSLMTFAAFVAAIGFSGCCSTGGSCPLSHGGKLGSIGKRAASATNVQSFGDQTIYSDAGDCGCGAPAVDQGMMQYAPADSGCGCGSPAPAMDCGCGAPAADSGAAACACGSDSVVSVSAPTDCGCGGAPVASSMPVMSDGGCGCSSCGDSSPVASPMQYSAPVASPIQYSAPASGGCSACEGASNAAPKSPYRFLGGRGLDKSGQGMGMAVQDRGLACNSGGAEGCAAGDNCGGVDRRAQRKEARSLKPQRSKKTLAERFGFAANETPSDSVETIDLVSNDYVGSGDAGGRHISHGFISDVRGARQSHFGDRGVAGGHAGCKGGGCGLGGCKGGGCGLSGAHGPQGAYGGQGAHGLHGGCQGGGCGQGGKLCGVCSKLRGLTGVGPGNPYGGAIPHTAQQPGQSGIAPQYAYPYYTTRGPRDFLRDNPPSIGR